MLSKRLFGRVVAFGAALFIGGQVMGATVIKLDFGRHNNGVDGTATTNPDVNGNYWNNLTSAVDGSTSIVPINSVFGPFITQDNKPTNITLKTLSGTPDNKVGYWEANGKRNGGLLNPDPALLGDFAIPTATEDYWFLNTPQEGQSSVSFELAGLDPTKAYNFRLFGTRDTAETRITRYIFTGLNSGDATLQTSGPGSASATTPGYNGNNDTIVSVNGIIPTLDGKIIGTLETVAGNYSYLGIMEITEVPEPAAAATLVGSLALFGLRRRQA